MFSYLFSFHPLRPHSSCICCHRTVAVHVVCRCRVRLQSSTGLRQGKLCEGQRRARCGIRVRCFPWTNRSSTAPGSTTFVFIRILLKIDAIDIICFSFSFSCSLCPLRQFQMLPKQCSWFPVRHLAILRRLVHRPTTRKSCVVFLPIPKLCPHRKSNLFFS